ncbi:glycoside hydrolase superfamily [Phascolomyces articulosus]|uniref:mannan endo-1,4-beta-mannosidase n=1 Tax=Phascolomyces articulosus TaxID=60185 RepID=A0AAD5JZB6_9FUNG|nr:glycoside hydrolase superfamily [Phascolomyces articulosus]
MKTFILSSLALAVASLLPGGVSAHPAHHKPGHGNNVDKEAFIKVNDDGTGFTRYGQPYMIRGANYWQGINLGADDCNGGDRERMEREVKQMAAMGINNVRVMAASEGPDDQRFRMRPSLMPKPGVYREPIFEGLDYLLDAIDRNNMTAVMTMNNFWHWSGGFSQYVAWIIGNQTIPYPEGDFGWDEFTQYSARFYNDTEVAPKAQQMFKDHIKTVITRKNTVNGKVYGEDPTIMSWQLANEPQEGPAEWFVDIGSYMKELAPNHLVSAGLESKEDHYDFLRAHDNDVIDYATCHLWVENRGVYDPSDVNTFQPSIDYGLSFLANTSTWASELGKPLIMEEFGMARDAFLKPYDLAFKLNPDTPTSHKDEFYGTLFDKIVDYAKEGKFTGSNFWAYAGEGRSTDNPNQYGMVWLGDPPHENRGWYSVYDKDTTVQVIKDYNAKLKALEESQ